MKLKLNLNTSEKCYFGPSHVSNGHWVLSRDAVHSIANKKCPMQKEFQKVHGSAIGMIRNKVFLPLMKDVESGESGGCVNLPDLTKVIPAVDDTWEKLAIDWENKTAARFRKNGEIMSIGFKLKSGGFVYVDPGYAPLMSGPWDCYVQPRKEGEFCTHSPIAFCMQDYEEIEVVGALMPMKMIPAAN